MAETDRGGSKTEGDSHLPLPFPFPSPSPAPNRAEKPYVLSSPRAPLARSSHGFSPASFIPVPQPLSVPPALPPFHFQVAQKCINNVSDIGKFHSSEAGKTFLGFVAGMNESIMGHKISDPCHESAPLKTLVSTLDHMAGWVEEIPPLQQRARYGNPAFRDWQARLITHGPTLIGKMLQHHDNLAIAEIFPYFADSFGNATRIDYGTGHEANFVAFLLCLTRLGYFNQDDYQALVSRVFIKYLDLMRKLQTTYWLEPAGSHGVWGLDDYHFLPFIFGSSQLVDHKHIKPKSIHNSDVLDSFSKEYLYLSCVVFVKKVKKGLLAENSPMLDDISGVPSWSKVNSGLLKMYKVEVLEKVPIMQHFLFGSLIRWEV